MWGRGINQAVGLAYLAEGTGQGTVPPAAKGEGVQVGQGM